MKKTMVFNLFFVLMMAPIISSAAVLLPISIMRFSCTTSTPCKMSTDSNKCVSKITLLLSSNHVGEEIISYYSMKNGKKEILPSEKHLIVNKMSIDAAKNKPILLYKIAFQNQTGDQWGQFIGTTSSQGNYQGTITIDQDFSFKVVCIYNDSIFKIKKYENH